jgi:hypothetical protein
MYTGLHVKFPLFFSHINQTLNVFTDSRKSLSIKFHKNPSSGSRVASSGRTDMTKPIVVFAILRMRLQFTIKVCKRDSELTEGIRLGAKSSHKSSPVHSKRITRTVQTQSLASFNPTGLRHCYRFVQEFEQKKCVCLHRSLVRLSSTVSNGFDLVGMPAVSALWSLMATTTSSSTEARDRDSVCVCVSVCLRVIVRVYARCTNVLITTVVITTKCRPQCPWHVPLQKVCPAYWI